MHRRSPLVLLLLALSLLSAAPARANYPATLNDYALELINRGEYDKALEQLQRAYSLNAFDETLRRNLAEAYVYVGRRHLEENRFEEAATYFDNARELFPDNPRYAILRGIALYHGK